MYIDERLIKILETHKEEQIHVTYAIDLIKKIAKEYEAKPKIKNKDLLLDLIERIKLKLPDPLDIGESECSRGMEMALFRLKTEYRDFKNQRQVTEKLKP